MSTRPKMYRFGIIIETDVDIYDLFVIDYNVDTIDPENEGVCSLQVRKPADWENETKSWQERMSYRFYVPDAVSSVTDSPVDKTPESPVVVPEISVADPLNSDLQAVYECALVGSWHAEPGFPAGYAQRYIFYTNYKFVFLQSQMDTVNPLISYWGTWKIEDDQLSLTVLHKRMIIGGEIVDDPTFGDTLEGGNVETIDLDPPVKLTYPLPSFEIDNVYFSSHENEISYRITIGEEDYWKLDTFDDFNEKQEFYNPLWQNGQSANAMFEKYGKPVAGTHYSPVTDPLSMAGDSSIVKIFKKYGWYWGVAESPVAEEISPDRSEPENTPKEPNESSAPQELPIYGTWTLDKIALTTKGYSGEIQGDCRKYVDFNILTEEDNCYEKAGVSADCSAFYTMLVCRNTRAC